ncbi:MAG: glycosyltransferase family 2 protein [Candidatus Omnitrophica bacterium]|nr:glycosyltransferase family 2 protein [Candidatus Omnitrophota bacterium]
MDKGLQLSIIIPAYNEEKRLPVTLERIAGYLKSKGYTFEIIVVDDGSNDKTQEVVRNFMRKYPMLSLIHNQIRSGKGAAVRAGILSSRGEFIFFSDADLSTPIDEIEKLLLSLKDGYDIAFASRAMSESQVVVREAWYRDIMGKIFCFLVRHLVVAGVRDSQCGFKGFRRDKASILFSRQRLNGFAFDVEILFLARKLNFSSQEIPVRWIDSPKSKVNPIVDSCKMLIGLFKIHLNNLAGKYAD